MERVRIENRHKDIWVLQPEYIKEGLIVRKNELTGIMIKRKATENEVRYDGGSTFVKISGEVLSWSKYEPFNTKNIIIF